MPDLPRLLTDDIADSQAEVVSWSAANGELVLQITKEIGPEVGLLRLRGVGLVYLPPRFEVAGVAAFDGPFPEYPHLDLDESEIAVCLHDSDGPAHLVIAETVEYEVTGR